MGSYRGARPNKPEARLPKFTWLLAATLGAATPVLAQAPAEENIFRTFLSRLFGPAWDVQVNVGAARTGRFLLQDVVGGQRELTGGGAWSFGLGGGFNLLPRVGFRLGYNYSNADLKYRDENGTGSNALDIDDFANIKRHLATLEIIRFTLPPSIMISPYGSIGLVGAWWVLDTDDVLIEPLDGGTKFRWGGLASFGMQFRIDSAWAIRAEYSTASIRNPFTGNSSFRTATGLTIDEPTRVSANDWRLAVVYSFGKPSFEVVRPRRR